VDPWVSAVYATPTVALAPLFIFMFGIDAPSKMAVVFLLAIFPVVINTSTGIRSTDRIYIEAARSFCASRTQIFSKVLIPSALPFIVAGLRLVAEPDNHAALVLALQSAAIGLTDGAVALLAADGELPQAARVAPGSLQRAPRIGADPDVRPGRWDNQVLEAQQDAWIAKAFAVSVGVETPDDQRFGVAQRARVDAERVLDEVSTLNMRKTLGPERWDKLLREASASLEAATIEETRAQIRAMSACEMVSFSKSSRTIASSTSFGSRPMTAPILPATAAAT